MLQCVAVCCSVLQCVAVCCSMLQCAAVYCSVLQSVPVCCSVFQCVPVCCSDRAFLQKKPGNLWRAFNDVDTNNVFSIMGWLQLVGSTNL